jgi:hypothetical protein
MANGFAGLAMIDRPDTGSERNASTNFYPTYIIKVVGLVNEQISAGFCLHEIEVFARIAHS